jgi:tripartite-type tricarboxylate transporter receptor subunit TctC
MNKRKQAAATLWLMLGAMIASVFGFAPVFAAAYPDHQIRIVVPYTPGGFNDTLARTVSEQLTTRWKQSVLVDNRPGGNTLIGNTIVARAAPDGYTLLITPLPFASLPSLYGDKMPYDSLKNFTPVIWAASTQNMLVVRSDSKIKSVRDLIDYAKKNPGKLNYASTGSGSSNHLSMALFLSMTGTKMTHVPYKGSAPAVVSMLSGDTDVYFDNMPNLVQQVRAGKLRALAVTGNHRAPMAPTVPTVAESGVPGYEVNVWFGIQAPGGTPPAVIKTLNQELVKVLRQPKVIKLFADQGVEVVASTPETFSQLIRNEITKWSGVVRDAHITLQ